MSYTQTPPPPPPHNSQQLNTSYYKPAATMQYIRPVRDIYSRIADIGQKGAVIGLLSLTVWGTYQFIIGYNAIHTRRVQWEQEHPDLTKQIAEQLKLEQEQKKARRG